MTLAELLAVIALAGIYFGIASVIAGPHLWDLAVRGQVEADARSGEAVANFVKEYSNFHLTQVGPDIVATTDSGIEMGRIRGTL